MTTPILYNNYEIIPCYEPYDKDTKKIEIHKECKFVRYLPKSDRNEDTHLAVLVHHYEDGTASKELKIIKDYKRPIWVTKKINRNYKDKKEFEHIDKLQFIPTTQSDMDNEICRALEIQPSPYNLRTLKDSPYIYGYDVPSTAFISYFYKKADNDFISPYKVVNLDIENDIDGEGEITIITLSTLGFRHTAALRRLYTGLYDNDEDIISAIKKKSKESLPDTKALRACEKYDVSLHKNDLKLIKFKYGMVHKMMPDFITYHNMVYDISKIIERLDKHGIYSANILADPSIPKNLKKTIFIPGKQFKIKKGIKKPIPMEEQWTTLDVFASFMCMDTMSMYDSIRQGQGKLVGGYSLANILEKNKLAGKLFYEDEKTKNMTKAQWHIYMSKYRPIEYTIYAEQDTIAMTDLELKTEDFSQSLPIFAGIADFNRFNSSVHKTTCNGYLENRHKGLIIGTTPKNNVDRSYLGTNDWIKALPSNHIQDIGLEVTNLPGVKTNVTAHAEDQDCVSSYPSDIQACNVSISTLRAEVLKIGNYHKTYFKNNNINLISSNANTIEYCNNMMNLPDARSMILEARNVYVNNKKDKVANL